MTTHFSPDDQAWCDALAGRLPVPSTSAGSGSSRSPSPVGAGPDAKPRDHDRHELQMAGLLGQAMRQPDGPPPPPLDDATLSRMMSGLRARGTAAMHAQRMAAPAGLAATRRPATATAPASAVPAQPNVRAAPQPAPGGWRRRPAGSAAAGTGPHWTLWAVPATVLMAMLAMLWLLSQTGGPPAGMEQSYSKSGPAAGVQHLRTRNPQAAADQLVAALSALGVPADVQADGDDRLVQAMVPPQDLASVNSALQGTRGLASPSIAAPPHGQLSVRFVRSGL